MLCGLQGLRVQACLLPMSAPEFLNVLLGWLPDKDNDSWI